MESEAEERSVGLGIGSCWCCRRRSINQLTKKKAASNAISARNSLARFLRYHEEEWDLRELERRLGKSLGVREVGELRSGTTSKSEADSIIRVRVRMQDPVEEELKSNESCLVRTVAPSGEVQSLMPDST
ncbi:hypothetical protein CR513_28284, partial [Mucuna pruriens]